MAFKPNSNKVSTDNTDRTPFVPIIPEDGLQAVQVGLLVNLGMHKKLPRFAKDNAGKREQDENGEDKVLWPKEGKDLEQRVGVYVDLLTQTHDYGEKIGVKNIRLPLHQVARGMSEGLNFTTVAPRDPDGNYIKGKPWSLAPASQWCKIAQVVKDEKGNKVSDTMLRAEYKNEDHNNVDLLLGKPFMFNVEVKKTEKDGNTFVNSKLKSPVPLMKGMSVDEALLPAFSIGFNDDDLLEEKSELEGACKFDLLRLADIRRIVLAADYEGTKIQEAIRERFDEDEIVTKAKEIAEKLIETDNDLIEIRKRFPNGPDGGAVEQPKVVAAKPSKPVKPSKPAATTEDDDFSDAPF